MINFGITEQKKGEFQQRMQKCDLFEKDIEEKFVKSGGSVVSIIPAPMFFPAGLLQPPSIRGL